MWGNPALSRVAARFQVMEPCQDSGPHTLEPVSSGAQGPVPSRLALGWGLSPEFSGLGTACPLRRVDCPQPHLAGQTPTC